MIGRVNGVNFTGIYGGTHAMGWQSVRIPEGLYLERALCNSCFPPCPKKPGATI